MSAGMVLDDLVGVHRHPGDVGPRPPQAADEPAGDGIADVHHDDRDQLGRPLRRQTSRRALGDQDIDVQTDQLSREVRELFPLPGRGSAFDDEVSAVDIAQLAEPVAQIFQAELLRACVVPQKADPVYLSRLLCLGRER